MKTGQVRLHTMCHFNELNFKIMQSIKHFVIEKNMGFGPGQTWLCILVLPLADSAVMGRFRFTTLTCTMGKIISSRLVGGFNQLWKVKHLRVRRESINLIASSLTLPQIDLHPSALMYFQC